MLTKQIELALSITPPKIKWHPLIKYELKNLEKDFAIASFERELENAHVNRIVNAVLVNEFYDIVFRVVEVNSKWVIIDAQHRITAFQILRDKHGLKTYDFMLAIYSVDKSRRIYRLLNMGKRLTAQDHTKALDTGKILFFNELRTFLEHYRTWNKMRFTDLLYAHQYVLKGKSDGSIHLLDTILKKITPKQVEQMKIFCQAIKDKTEGIPDNPLYRASVYRTLYKECLTKSLNLKQMHSLISYVKSHSKIEELSRGRRFSHFLAVEEIIQKRNSL